MDSANMVRVTKVHVKKDRLGVKLARIEITRVVDESDRFTDSVALALRQMAENSEIETVRLTETVPSRTLVFFAAAGIERPSDTIADVEIGNFKVWREDSAVTTRLVLSFEFTVRLDEARRWLIPSIGDDVLCVVEQAQLSLGGL
jgi:hypothetical protein